ncbi:MAG: Uma2 family endonuclease [Desulfobacteraceae bacterium]|nr:Uma2 family endonuclease [Desulfobacteraceae bacterium]
MAEATLRQTTDEWPDISGLVTEDDTPVDNIFSEKQQRMLTESLNTSWKPGKPFMAVSDIAVFYDTDEPPVVPDVFLSLDVSPPEDVWKKRNRSYFLREYGKPPEVAVEIVSNSEGEESGKKMKKYALAGVRYYIIYDPQKLIQNDSLRIFELSGGGYIPKLDRSLIRTGLSVTLWEGVFDGMHKVWLRWVDHEGNLIPNGDEQRHRADMAEQKAEEERSRADMAEQKAEILAAKLRTLGIDPEG